MNLKDTAPILVGIMEDIEQNRRHFDPIPGKDYVRKQRGGEESARLFLERLKRESLSAGGYRMTTALTDLTVEEMKGSSEEIKAQLNILLAESGLEVIGVHEGTYENMGLIGWMISKRIKSQDTDSPDPVPTPDEVIVTDVAAKEEAASVPEKPSALSVAIRDYIFAPLDILSQLVQIDIELNSERLRGISIGSILQYRRDQAKLKGETFDEEAFLRCLEKLDTEKLTEISKACCYRGMFRNFKYDVMAAIEGRESASESEEAMVPQIEAPKTTPKTTLKATPVTKEGPIIEAELVTEEAKKESSLKRWFKEWQSRHVSTGQVNALRALVGGLIIFTIAGIAYRKYISPDEQQSQPKTAEVSKGPTQTADCKIYLEPNNAYRGVCNNMDKEGRKAYYPEDQDPKDDKFLFAIEFNRGKVRLKCLTEIQEGYTPSTDGSSMIIKSERIECEVVNQ